MTEPVRLRALGAAAPAGVAELLDAARAPRALPDDVQDRVALRIAVIAAAPLGAASLGESALRSKLASLLAFVGVGVVIGLALFLARRSNAPTIVEATGSAPAVTVVASANPVVMNSAPLVVASAASSATVPAIMAPPSVSAPKPDEQALLDAAMKKLGAGDPGGALERLDEHKKLYPAGKHVEEREWMSIKSLSALGRTADAKKRAAAYVTRWPSGLYVEQAKKLAD